MEIKQEKTLIEDLAEIKAALTTATLTKSGHNAFQNFDYFELSDFLPTVIRLCAERKILTLFEIKTLEDGNEYAVLSTIRGMEKITQVLPTAEPSGNNPIQQAGSKFTYMRRYAYITFFDICEPDTVDNKDQNTVKKTAFKYATPLQIEKIATNGKVIADELKALNVKSKNDIKALTIEQASDLCMTIDERTLKG